LSLTLNELEGWRGHAFNSLAFKNDSLMLDSAQIRAARALLGWRQEDLSKASGVGTATIQRIEKSHRPITGYVSTVVRIQAAFEQAGIQFIEDDETGGFGLRMAKKKRKR
jgi:transcriptional regulator with XRE-family HTH domain